MVRIIIPMMIKMNFKEFSRVRVLTTKKIIIRKRKDCSLTYCFLQSRLLTLIWMQSILVLYSSLLTLPACWKVIMPLKKKYKNLQTMLTNTNKKLINLNRLLNNNWNKNNQISWKFKIEKWSKNVISFVKNLNKRRSSYIKISLTESRKYSNWRCN